MADVWMALLMTFCLGVYASSTFPSFSRLDIVAQNFWDRVHSLMSGVSHLAIVTPPQPKELYSKH